VPYYIVSEVPQTRWIATGDNLNLTISAGTSIVFGAETGITNTESSSAAGGTLVMNGTATNPINLSGYNSGSGAWYGVYYGNSLQGNTLNYTNIDGAGEYDPQGAGFLPAAVMVEYDGSINMTNCGINNIAGCGVSVENGGVFTESGNTYTNISSNNLCEE